MPKTNKEIIAELDGYASEINRAIMGEPDEETGYHKSGPILGEFLTSRCQQFNVFESAIRLQNFVAIDRNEQHKKQLLVERTINAVQDIVYKLEETLDILKAIPKT